MNDKELDAIVKCHEALKDLSNDSRTRIFRYLSDRYNVEGVNPLTEGASRTASKEQSANGSNKTSNQKTSSKKKSRKTSSGSNESYSLLSDLDLMPKDQESLEDFYSKYKTSNNFERNIVILYYLKNILNVENVNVNHVYTCYKKLSLRIPILGQSLRDTKSRKGWVDTSNSDDLQVTVAGENYIEHEIDKVE